MPRFGQRLIIPELLDDAEPQVARANLQDLARINRYFGGHRTLKQMTEGVLPRDEKFSLLDAGAGSGDMGALLASWYPKACIVSLDYRLHHLEAAHPPKVVADAFHPPFPPRSFDFVLSSLFLHHFKDTQVVELLRGFGVLARRAVLAVDLERGPLAHGFLPATRWLFGWQEITLHDGPISVGAAFKRRELLELARQAGFASARVRVHRPWARLSLVAPVSS